ncbi:hypothetical protein E1B28_001109 [Marasmius oreades]|uniref:NADH dehydrogenase [ubiquinone] 1 alpha subcomplex subunit 5 n=1 Tax=Marasmius oreades TaxID=181124 RepID=A0A9P7V2Q3_9AGAR|nr:uncharacterized protein E1B28_001109 [Marasmius oreades]KAG7099246.1 hypothetical protein E1B28_001109 [Marasmius oreades]
MPGKRSSSKDVIEGIWEGLPYGLDRPRRDGTALKAGSARSTMVVKGQYSSRAVTTLSPTKMFRFTRPLYQVTKTTTRITGLAVHPHPLSALAQVYESTLTALNNIPTTSVYRQGVEALTLRKLSIVKTANGDITAVEKQLEEGQIEESLHIAEDELSLVGKMAEWKPWEPLEEKPEPGQWEYFGTSTT